jgi:hypothetical protein
MAKVKVHNFKYSRRNYAGYMDNKEEVIFYFCTVNLI